MGAEASVLKNAVLLDVTPYGFCEKRHFGGKYSFHYQGEKNQQARNNSSSR
jgi:hypothetical protein